MRRASWMMMLAVLGLAAVVGCGKSTAPNNEATAAGGEKEAGPAATVTAFMEAVRTGNDEKALGLLSATARQKSAGKDVGVTPPASDTARFTIGKVEMIGEGGARVACDWTDLDENGKPRTDHALWITRHEPEGWRVVGVAATVFEGEDPLLLNFEDPDEMVKKQQWLREEMARRSHPAGAQAKTAADPGDPLRR
jgi:hypothetical protein